MCMADVYDTKIEILREKSRALLEELEKNSKIVESEIKKLNISARPCTSEINKKTLSSWLIRNDSKRVSELLNPLNEEMTVGRRVVVTSKRLGASGHLRKAVAGCYCNRIPEKVQYRSARSVFWPFELCHHCKSHFDVTNNTEEPDEAPLSPGINAETLQRVQSINYTPRSEFLRRVQKKVSQQFSSGAEQLEITPEVSHQHSSSTSHGNQGNHWDSRESREAGGGSNRILHKKQADTRQGNKKNEFTNLYDESTIIDPHPGELIEVPVEVHRADTSVVSVHNGSRERAPVIDEINVGEKNSFNTNKSKDKERTIEQTQREFSPEIEIILPPRVSQKKSTKSIPKKTISSTKCNDEKKKNKKEKSTDKRKKNVRSYYDSCCSVNRKKKSGIFSKCDDCCCHTDRCLSCLASVTLAPQTDCDKKVVELRKFREKNYYDTHDSSQTILSSASSGSLEKFELNNRLFPESIGKVHKDNIIISMPPCATKQLKRIHYFPRYIVHENKNHLIHNSNENHKHRSCPLTGHAIDVARLKPACPSNSLALKYQKGTM